MSSRETRRPLTPVPPHDMEIIFLYTCPHCGAKVAVISPTKPAMARCDSCGEPFPLTPVDERTIQYIRLMLADGRAAVDPDFI